MTEWPWSSCRPPPGRYAPEVEALAGPGPQSRDVDRLKPRPPVFFRPERRLRLRISAKVFQPQNLIYNQRFMAKNPLAAVVQEALAQLPWHHQIALRERSKTQPAAKIHENGGLGA